MQGCGRVGSDPKKAVVRIPLVSPGKQLSCWSLMDTFRSTAVRRKTSRTDTRSTGSPREVAREGPSTRRAAASSAPAGTASVGASRTTSPLALAETVSAEAGTPYTIASAAAAVGSGGAAAASPPRSSATSTATTTSTNDCWRTTRHLEKGGLCMGGEGAFSTFRKGRASCVGGRGGLYHLQKRGWVVFGSGAVSNCTQGE